MAEGRGWGLGKNNRVGIVVVGLIGNWVAEVIQKSISISKYFVSHPIGYCRVHNGHG